MPYFIITPALHKHGCFYKHTKRIFLLNTQVDNEGSWYGARKKIKQFKDKLHEIRLLFYFCVLKMQIRVGCFCLEK